MQSIERFKRRIEKLKDYSKSLDKQYKRVPLFRGYSLSEIDTIEQYDKAEQYVVQPDLFGNVPIDPQVYEAYKKQKQYVKYKTTAYRRTAKEFDGLDEDDVKRIVTSHKRALERDEYYWKKRELQGVEAEIEEFRKEANEAMDHNSKIRERQCRITDINFKIANKINELELKNGLDVVVRIDFKGLPATNWNGEMSGSLVFLSKYITKEELEIARVNNRIKVIAGDLDKSLDQCDFISKSVKGHRERCTCGKPLSYNEIGINKKLGRKEAKDWLCTKCLGISEDWFMDVSNNYKSTGCNLFI